MLGWGGEDVVEVVFATSTVSEYLVVAPFC